MKNERLTLDSLNKFGEGELTAEGAQKRRLRRYHVLLHALLLLPPGCWYPGRPPVRPLRRVA